MPGGSQYANSPQTPKTGGSRNAGDSLDTAICIPVALEQGCPTF